MVRFDLQGKRVGARIIAAIQRAAQDDEIALDCTEAQFVTAANFDTVRFAEARFTGAHFERGLRLRQVTFNADAAFDRVRGTDFFLEDATFEGVAGFRGLKVANLGVKDSRFGQYASFDRATLGFGSFRDVEFAAEARFRSLTSRGPLSMRSVRFAAAASFQGSTPRSSDLSGV